MTWLWPSSQGALVCLSTKCAGSVLLEHSVLPLFAKLANFSAICGRIIRNPRGSTAIALRHPQTRFSLATAGERLSISLGVVLLVDTVGLLPKNPEIGQSGDYG